VQAQPETLQGVQGIISKQLSIDESTVTPQTKFADLGADSLDIVCPEISLYQFLTIIVIS
jgi:acyl carrier protein